MLKRVVMAAVAASVFALPAGAKTFEEIFPQYVGEFDPEIVELLSAIDYQQGQITVGDGLASLNVSDGYYYLDPQDAEYVLTELWGNPPSPVLGMVFPADVTPLHDSAWGLEMYFDEIGYVSDEDAATYDYDEVLGSLRADIKDENEWRVQNGYPKLELVGWAEAPKYDGGENSLYWAKELAFEDSDENTLNYNIRVLGRKGVLVQNFIAPMSALAEVQAAVPEILAMTDFTQGNAYADFDPSIDKVAAVGIGGLIAGKAIAKTGLIAMLLVFLKKGFVLLLLPLIWLKNLFTGRSRQA